MIIVVKEGVRVNVKETQRIMKERGFRFRTFSHNPRRFSVYLTKKGMEMYNNDIEAMMNMVFAVENIKNGTSLDDGHVMVGKKTASLKEQRTKSKEQRQNISNHGESRI